ncbi:hypothetical protein [Rhodococcus sp. B50]|uniref:hypothetical protein n=1 Tax=Rhodococcus sp. B50 TaxID=2682847 RepID=UPI001FD5378E|nr:hypothetical protein [Rhodococcus sp. B50]MBS9375086.1 hypothetical protein [Rhodococcus sp. B50]
MKSPMSGPGCSHSGKDYGRPRFGEGHLVSDLCLSCGRAECTERRHHSLAAAIGAGKALAEASIRADDTRDQVVVVGNAIANLLLYVADTRGVAAAQEASEHGQIHFHGDWIAAGRPWGPEDP